MSKYKVGDKFIVEIEAVGKEGTYKVQEGHWFAESIFSSIHKIDSNMKIEDITDMIAEYETEKKGYNRGLVDAWELAKKIVMSTREKDNAYTGQDLTNIFGDDRTSHILNNFAPQEALAKIEAYEESKAIKKGNIVLNVREDVKAVIMDNAIAEGAWQVYTENGCVELWKECEFKKTGKTVDIEHLLEQIRGNE